jgi:hypothetical protein
MKKIILTLIVFSSLNSNAQEKRNEFKEKLTTEQQNQLQLKKMTLELDLTASQQKEIEPILAEQNSKKEAKRAEMRSNRENHKELSANERYEIKNKMLDEQIEFKSKMKKILNKDQYEKWSENRKENFKKAMKRRNSMKHNEVSE